LKEKLKSICKKYKVGPGLVVREVDSKEFGRKVEVAFADEMNKLVNEFDIAIRECRTNPNEFKKCFLKLYLKSKQYIVSKDKYLFMEEFVSTQAVACYYDGIIQKRESSYQRTQEVKSVNSTIIPKTMIITHKLTANHVIKRLSQIADIVVSERLITKSDLFTEKFNWFKEIETLKNSSRSTAEVLLRETLNSSFKKDKFNLSAIGNSKILVEMLDIEEVKVKSSEIKLYGKKGTLAFLYEFMRLDYREK
jgi:hypothetical protein